MVIDTQSFIWMEMSQHRLSGPAATAIRDTEAIYVPDIALWEVAMLSAYGRIELDKSIEEWLEEAINESKIIVVPITPAIAAKSVELKMHGDPSDRLVVATALCLGMPLITSDRKIRDSGLVKTIW